MSASVSLPRVAFLGLGIMGGGMARRLLGAGFPVAVFNRNRAKADVLATAGATVAGTARAAAKDADLVVCMVADDVASRAMWLGNEGALASAPHGAVVVDCSTLSLGWVKELALAAEMAGCELVDAPVTGSKAQAAAGELNFLVGGSAPALEKARAALNAMGRSVTHFGPTGSGALVKLVNNFLAGVQIAAFAEGLAWLERTDIDRAKVVEFLLGGAAGSPITKTVSARMTSGDFSPNFFLRLMAKDLRYATIEAASGRESLLTAQAALERFEKALAAGHGDKDMAAVVLPLRQKQT